MEKTPSLYSITLCLSFAFGLIFTPLARFLATRLNVFDHPISSVKTHKAPVPYFGGAAIFGAFALALIWIRFFTSFPSGTLRTLRGILFGGGIVFFLGLIDDIKHHGLHYRTKFFFQILAASLVVYFGIRIKFIQPSWLATTLTIVWIVGVTNAFNLIDIMDGLCSGVAIACSMAFILISLPTEDLHVNFAAAALCGAALGFLPFNLSKRMKIFMGDSGSLFLGFVLSSLALGTNYSGKTELGLFAPIAILAVPIYDTLLVFVLRIRRGVSPFLGSKDHFALRLEKCGWNRPRIVLFSVVLTAIFSFLAFSAIRSEYFTALIFYSLVAGILGFLTSYILKVDIK